MSTPHKGCWVALQSIRIFVPTTPTGGGGPQCSVSSGKVEWHCTTTEFLHCLSIPVPSKHFVTGCARTLQPAPSFSSYLYPPKGANFGPLWRFRPCGRLLFPEVQSSFFINCCQCSKRLFTSKGRLLPGSVLVRSVLVDTGLKY